MGPGAEELAQSSPGAGASHSRVTEPPCMLSTNWTSGLWVWDFGVGGCVKIRQMEHTALMHYVPIAGVL